MLLLWTSSVLGQKAENISATKINTQNLSACADQFAGNVSMGNVIAQSEAVSLPGPIFLCYQDRFTIFNSNADLTGDPDGTTAPGVGYAFFDCPPTATGPNLNDIESDPCVLQTPPPNPTNNPDLYDLWVYTDQSDGTALFQNSNQLGGMTIPEFFNNGNPIQIYFAPITFDDFGNNRDEDNGQCINMNAAEAFPVVYLNEIKILDCTFDLVNNEYMGSFVLEGGFPEYNGSTYTSVAVIKNNNFNDQAQIIGGPFMHGDLVNFVADEPGNYSILVQDGLSCGGAKDMELIEDDNELTVSIDLPPGPFEPGQYVCATFTVTDFDSITSMQWTINFDPNVLEWDATLPCSVPGLDAFNLPTYGVESGFIPFQWFDADANGVDLDDGECIYDICFNVIGNPGDCTDIFIDGTPTSIAVSCCENGDVQLNIIDTMLCIQEPTDVEIIAGSCGANNSDEGSISFYFVGGTAPYQYASNCFPNGIVNNSGEEVFISGLSSGNCTISVFDATGNTAEIVVNVSDLAPITYDIVTQDPTCYGVPNAEIALENIMGGNPDYDFAWSNNVFGTDNITSLAEGTYFVTISDQSGCEVEQAFVVGTDPILVDIVITDTTSCIDGENGVVVATAEGGTPIPNNNYDYQWSNPVFFDPGVSSSTHTDVPSGIGVVRVTDDNGCSVTIEYDMPFVKEVSALIDVTQPQCNESTGSVVVTGTTSDNSCGTFAFIWESGIVSINSPNTSTVEDLIPGTYYVTIEDCDGCRKDTMVVVEASQPIMLPYFTEFECADPTGCITVFPGGGTGAISLEWADDPTISNSIRCDLDPGTYTLTATDEAGCDTTIMIELDAGVQILPDTFFVTEIDCAGDMDGIITVDVPGAGPYNYTWDGPEGMIYPDDETITMLGAGWYYVTISDGSGCEAVDSVEMPAPDTIFINPVISIPSCNGESDAQIALVVTGGDDTNGYSYSWDGFPGVIGPILTDIPHGEYDVTVFDSKGCEKDTTIIVPDQDTIVIDINILDGIDCNGETDAQVEVVFSGGPSDNGSYGVIWTSTESEPLSMISTDTAFLLEAGINSVIVFDAVCSDTLEFELTEPDKIVLDQTQVQLFDASCFGLCDGSALIEAIGGDGNFSYTWEATGNMNQTETDLCAGWHYVEIMDGNGCIVRDSVLIGQPDTLILDIDIFNTVDPACNDEGDGIITVDYEGGNVGPVTYTWTDDVSDDASASGLVNGTYVITVTDQNGCTDTTSYTLSSSPPITADVPSPEEPPCFGERTCIEILNPGGGSGTGYRFSINNSNLFPIDSCVQVFAGEYLVTIFDSEGCSFDTTIIIEQPSELLASLGDDIVFELGDSTTQLTVELNQTFVVDTIIWSSTQPYECVDEDCESIFIYPDVDAVYTVTAIDENGCEATDQVFVRIDDERKVYFPNIFTPNGDGINDVFQLFTGQGVVEVDVFQVYDRWGNLMFEANDLTPNPGGTIGWDGTFNGQSLDAGVFAYRALITFVDGKTIPYSGTITLIR